ncbi:MULTISPECIES: hypothetical protein [Streptomyces]|uniref:Uncharacterized protein n=1 Tax=Streptomyces lasalocidi TaxID=324833 RepID=A0A4U5WK97_STRLS|nr:hypothetical protein [Streptomyces lasalocidi]TKT00926.1 hypothetical protein E4U91_12900 [Streptomyces lasalocidi]
MGTDAAATSKGRRVLRGLAALAVTAALTAAAGGDRARDYPQGDGIALPAQASFLVGYEHAQVGDEYWVGGPLPENGTDRPLTVLRMRMQRVPEGLEVVRYGTATLRQTGGYALGVIQDLAVGPARPFVVAPHGQAGAYVWTRVRVTGPVRGRLSGCRFWYRQGVVEFRQDVGCETVLRLGPSVR